MTITAKDWKAVQAYTELNHLRPLLSLVSIGDFYFEGPTDTEVKVSIYEIRRWMKEQSKKNTEA